MEKRICKYCNKEFLFRTSKGKGKGVFCSVKCQHLGSRSRIEKPCDFCGKVFSVEPHRFKSGRGKFCSSKCTKIGMFTPEVRAKMSARRKGKPTGRTGDKCHFWKGGVTPKSKADRMSLDLRNWRNAVYERDDFTCQECGQRGGRLNADHIKPFAYFPELRFAIDNGRTLCVDCHRRTDNYGGKSNRILPKNVYHRRKRVYGKTNSRPPKISKCNATLPKTPFRLPKGFGKSKPTKMKWF